FPWELGTASAQVPLVYASGSHGAAPDRALELAGYDERRREQTVERTKGAHGRLLGIGMAAYVALTGLGPYEGAILRVDATGRVELIIGASPHGQGTATVLAQVVADALAIEPRAVNVEHADTALIPFGTRTYPT